MDSNYHPHFIEKNIYKQWEKNGYFSPQIKLNSKISYSIMIPPPNITGSLHMGHAFQYTIQDTLIRMARMQNKKTMWQVGTDHAGIATQIMVEKKLILNKEPNKSLIGRPIFVKKIWKWKEKSNNIINLQMKRLGNSVDWKTKTFTMDPKFNKAVLSVFEQLYNQGLIYKGKRLINWDPKLQTAISDIEVQNKNIKSEMWSIRYKIFNYKHNKQYIVVSTTRPETILADTAIAINPKDQRYNKLIEQYIKLPLNGRIIPIIIDKYANIEKGTGCVKITPAHDFNDYNIGKYHKLPTINILTLDAKIRKQALYLNFNGTNNKNKIQIIPEQLVGLKRYQARKKIILMLKKLNLIDIINFHTLIIPCGDRSNTIIEPMLMDQWYIDTKTISKPAIDAVKNEKIKFIPKQYENMYFSWMHNIQDWCISRQLWWGHRIPAWYDLNGKVYIAQNKKNIYKKYKLKHNIKLIQDRDVLDTWFSSSIWTFASLGWPKNTKRLQIFHPTDILVTGFDIIFYWVARMIMMSIYFCKSINFYTIIPFKNVYITGLIRDKSGNKMSKSKGNTMDPLDMIDGINIENLLKKRTFNVIKQKIKKNIIKQTKREFPKGIKPYGTDALRFTLTSLASTGRDINWNMKRLEGYRNFCNKIYNASHYVLSNINNNKMIINKSQYYKISIIDQWIESIIQITIKNVKKCFKIYRFDLASKYIYNFIWHEYCNWYIELSKIIIYNNETNNNIIQGTSNTLIYTLEIILRLAHPIMPFITEHIWQSCKQIIKKGENTIMFEKYPKINYLLNNPKKNLIINWLKNIITKIRKIRKEFNIIYGINLPIYVQQSNTKDRLYFKITHTFLIKLLKLKNIICLRNNDKTPLSIIENINNIKILIPIYNFIDQNKELYRLDNEHIKIEQSKINYKNKLINEQFVKNAPKLIVEKEKEKLINLDNIVYDIKKQKNNIKNLID